MRKSARAAGAASGAAAISVSRKAVLRRMAIRASSPAP